MYIFLLILGFFIGALSILTYFNSIYNEVITECKGCGRQYIGTVKAGTEWHTTHNCTH